MSFGIFDSWVLFLQVRQPADPGFSTSTHILSDPTAFEEPLLDTTLSVVVDNDGELVSVTQLGLSGAGAQDPLLLCITTAKKRREKLAQYI